MKIAMLLSGGVDSSVAMKKLLELGNDVYAYYLKVWLQDDLAFLGECPWEEDLQFASSVAKQMGVQLTVVSMQDAYWSRVVSYAIAEIKAGRTPNPDIMCNATMKFGAFYENYGKNFSAIASGHYARLQKIENGNTTLALAKDAFKDQTYFLARLSQEQLARCIFPLGDFMKGEVREMASDFKLENAARKDSQGVCFLGKIKFSDFVRFHFGTKSGAIVHAASGKTMGTHEGHWFYTIGQRRGLRLGNGPWLVSEKDVASNTIYISHIEEPARLTERFHVEDLCIFVPERMWNLEKLQVKVRHGKEQLPVAGFKKLAKKNTALVQLKTAEVGIASGQFAVFYSEGLCVGSGVMQREILS